MGNKKKLPLLQAIYLQCSTYFDSKFVICKIIKQGPKAKYLKGSGGHRMIHGP